VNPEEKEFFKLLTKENYRGITTDELVYRIQYEREQLEFPELFSTGDVETFIFMTQEHIKGIEWEIERRRKLSYDGVQFTNKEIIQTIKNAIDITDVLAWYTDVFTYKRQWTYRCTLHGDDKHPSGVIYKDDQRFHCFACGKHGDIFDAVMYFERVDLPAAIKKLARHVGLDVKPLVRGKQYQDIKI